MSEETVPSLAEDNERRLQVLAEAGVAIDPTLVLKARLDMVTDILVDATQFPADKLETVWQLYLGQLLDVLEQGINDGSDQ